MAQQMFTLIALLSCLNADQLYTKWEYGYPPMPINSIKSSETDNQMSYSTARNPIGHYDNAIYLLSMLLVYILV